MLYAAWKSLLGRKFRLLLSMLSIVLGVAFVSASLMFTSLLSGAFDQILKAALADVNVGTTMESAPGQERPTYDQALVDRITGVDGVSRVAGLVTSAAVYLLDRDGKVVGYGGAPGLASNFDDIPAAGGHQGAHILEGRAPAEHDEVAVDPSSLERAGASIGDQVTITTPVGERLYRVSGTATYGSGATGGVSYLFFTLPEIREIALEGEAAYTDIWVSTAEGADPEAVAERITALLPEGTRAISGNELARDVEEQLNVGLGFVNTFLLVFAGIALLVAALLILNTFSILVAQRTRELALLRALGARRSQVRDSVLAEAGLVGLLGGLLGLGAGYGLARLIHWGMGRAGVGLGDARPELSWQVVAISVAVSVLVTVVAAFVPARKASATRPVQAMTAAALAPSEPPGMAVTLGALVLPLGVGAVVCGLFMDVPVPLAWVGLGCAAVLVGAVMVAGLLGRPVVTLFGGIYRSVFGEVGRMAALNAGRQPRRTGATAATLMIGLALVTTVAVLATSTTTSVRASLTDSERGDFVLSPVNFMPFPRSVADAAAQVEGVADAWVFRNSSTRWDDDVVTVTGVTPAALAQGVAVAMLAGGLNTNGPSCVVSQSFADEHGLALGQNFTLPLPREESVELQITGIFDKAASRGRTDIYVNEETFPILGDLDQVQRVVIALTPGADPATVRQGLEDTVAEMPTVLVTDNEEYTNQRVEQFSQAFGTIYALLALAVIISVLGIVNTLGLSVLERTREIGLLRAVGMTRPQLARMVRLESVVVAVLGSVLGVLLGLGFGVALVRMLADSGITHLQIPWLLLGSFVLGAALVGVLAAIGPSRRAARLDVLNAISQE